MTYRLFIDDERYPPDDGNHWVIVRTSAEAISYVDEHGCPDYISFDHDLGGDDTAVVFLKWFINRDLDHWEESNSSFIPGTFDFYVHSQNPVGAKRIKSELNSYLDLNHLRQMES